MAISFQSDEEVLRKLRDKLRKMTDEEVRFGKEVRTGLRKIRFSGDWMKRGQNGSGGKDWKNGNE